MSLNDLVRKRSTAVGFGLVEILIIIAMVAALAGIGIPGYLRAVDDAKNKRAAADIRTLEAQIKMYQRFNRTLPDSLSAVDNGGLLDPWGNPYAYLNYAVGPSGQIRKDHNLHPLNSDYDLYSKGKDGVSAAPLTAQMSRDDIVRASDGGFVGLASKY